MERTPEITASSAYNAIREIIEQYRKAHGNTQALFLCDDIEEMIDDIKDYLVDSIEE
jgi:predicted DNA-binding protein